MLSVGSANVSTHEVEQTGHKEHFVGKSLKDKCVSIVFDTVLNL